MEVFARFVLFFLPYCFWMHLRVQQGHANTSKRAASSELCFPVDADNNLWKGVCCWAIFTSQPHKQFYVMYPRELFRWRLCCIGPSVAIIEKCSLSVFKYKENEEIVVWMNTVGPYHNRQETYEYFSLPFCKGTKKTISHYHENLGEALQGVELEFSGLDVSFKSKQQHIIVVDYSAQDCHLIFHWINLQ